MIAISLPTIFISIVLAFSVEPSACAKSQPEINNRKSTTSAMSQQEELRVQKAADRFIRRFRKALDFSAVFNDEFVKDPIQRLRKAGFFKSMNLSPQLIESVEDPALERTYKAFMNYYYLKAAYDLGVGKSDSTPLDVVAALKTSRFANLLSDEGSGDSITIATRQELEEFINDLSTIGALYKGYLSPNVFESATYKEGIRGHGKARRRLRIRDGYESFGVAKGTKVYELEKDIFTFFFVEENGKLKVLTLGMGD